MGWDAPAARVYANTCPGWTVPCTTVAVVPGAKTMFSAAGVVVVVGWGVGLGGMEVGVGRGASGVGLGRMGMGLGRMGVGGLEIGRLQPTKSRIEMSSEAKIEYTLL